ncbi:alpha-amylase [Photobacterium jeanii]|uniref:Alpha-amylase n=1 Tax=Photobacterium jeanii TaxID=858640 RepID=A0A178K0J1_9GAMM|nr:alpha-amylase family protein [Photobacterium jeanii]OAN10849.1 alpha-amylase [Photobacterium jeanii]PST90364.1 alpha-amylase [Photobacterium jeanii]
MFKKPLLLAAAFAGCALSSTASADVILHAFNWKYSDITANASAIAQAGYKKVLIAPAMKSSGNEWWARYQPQDLRLIDSELGNKEDLEKLIAVMKKNGIEVYADVVLNHMANESWKRADLNYPGKALLDQYKNNAEYFERQKLFGDLSKGLFSSNDFHPAGCISDWDNPGNVQYWRLCGTDGDTGLPDLDPNHWVVDQQRQYLKALKAMGIKGFRIDAVKHMSQYQIDQIFTNEITQGMHVFGEVITSGGKGNSSFDKFLAPYLNNTAHGAYDFPLFASMRAAFSYNGSMQLLHDPEAYGQALSSQRAVTFTITHDIPTNKGFRYQIMDPTDEKLAYSYIMGRDGGTPLVYSDELPDHEDADHGRWADVWNRSEMVKMISFHNAMQGKTMEMMHSDQCLVVFKREKAGLVGINKCGTDKSYTIDTNRYEFNWYQPYQDVLSGHVETINSRYHTVTVPARSAIMLKN